MTKKRKKRRKSILRSTFYRVYFAAVILCVIGIAIGARWLNGVLADYELAQPVHVAEAAAKMFEDADYDTVYDYDTSAAELANGDKAFYVERMNELASGKAVSWSEGYTESEREKVYNVTLGDEKFAQIKLAPSGNTTAHGNTLWKLDSVTTLVTLGEAEPVEEEVELPEEEPEPVGIPCKVTAPTDSKVVVDGATLTAENSETVVVPAAPANLLPKGVEGPTLTEYTFYSESGAPEISVTDVNGNAQELVHSEDYAWSCSLPEDEELKEKFKKPVVAVAKQIARCSAKTTSKEAVLKLCVKKSPAYKSISAFDDSTGVNRKPEKFQNVEVSNFHRYSDNCFSCHVSFDYLSKFTAKVIKTYPTTLTLYFVTKGKSGLLYSFTLY